MSTLGEQIKLKELLKIKRIVDEDNDGDKFIIVRTKKNMTFMQKYEFKNEDVKNIVRQLTVQDCFAGPEKDRDSKYSGMIFKFCPFYGTEKLYIKIRVENNDKSICLSIHEYGNY